MGNVAGILKRDFKSLLKNPFALIVVVALLVLPGLYAWYCIIANWDPYSNTGRMPIAIVNEDTGVDSPIAGEVDVGAKIVDGLKDNDNIDWRFYDTREEALADTARSVCYATIVFPETLSADMAGILDGTGGQPTVYYYPNEKYSAVATKVCDSAANTVVTKLNQQFSATVNQTVLEKAEGLAGDIEEHAEGTRASALQEIADVRADIDGAIGMLDDALGSIAGWKKAVESAGVTLDATSNELPGIRSALDAASAETATLREGADAFSGRVSDLLISSSAALSNLSASASASIGQAAANLEAILGELNAIERELEPQHLEKIRELIERLRAINETIEEAIAAASDRVAEINDRVQTATQDISNATVTISSEVMPKLDAGAYQLGVALSGLSGAIGQFEPQVAEMGSMLVQSDGALDRAAEAIEGAKGLLRSIGEHLDKTMTDISALGSALKIDKVSELLSVDPSNLGEFISSPAQLVTEKVYPVSNYGTAVAPFYTNLALWIGCFILVSIIRLEPDRRKFPTATDNQCYFARWLLFVILSLIQSQAICGVDILLGIDCAHPVLFMLSGAICSFTYMNIIFALVITFRNIGKTLCILLLIMQVPGSSGMYPIEIMPGFFQFVHPALPFTYGIDAMRESLCGFFGLDIVGDFAFLLLLVPLFLLLGLVIRPLLLNLTHMFDQEASATGFFAAEIHSRGRRIALFERLLSGMAVGELRDEVEGRAWSFARVYPRLRLIGSIAVLAIPFVLLLLMALPNALLDIPTDTKLAALIIMLVVLLAVQAALIVLERIHRQIRERTRLLGLQIMNESDLANESPEAMLAMAEVMLEDGEETEAGLLAKLPAHAPGPVRDIFLTDLKLGFRSVVGVVIVALLVVTPSMYAWFNIAGSWDPYSSTGNLKVAVANDDEGYKGDLLPLTVRIGDTLVSQLRSNASFDWQFTDSTDAVAGVESGEYYASIVIPVDFSKNMLTYMTDMSGQRENGSSGAIADGAASGTASSEATSAKDGSEASYPVVVYYTNEKENPIAPIITQKGADSIQEGIRSSFTKSVDEIVLAVSYDLIDYATKPSVSGYVAKMGAHLDEAIGDMRLGASEFATLSGLSKTIDGIIATTGTALDGIRGAGSAAVEAVSSARQGAGDATEAFAQAASVIEGLLSGSDSAIDDIVSAIDSVLTALDSTSETVVSKLDRSIEIADEAIAVVGDVQPLHDQLVALRDALQAARDHAAEVPGRIEVARAELDTLAADAKASADGVRNYFDNDLKPNAESLRVSLESAMDGAGTIVGGLEGVLSGLSSSTDGLSGQLEALSVGFDNASTKLAASAGTLEDTKRRVTEAINSGDVKLLEEVVLGADPETLASSLAQPVKEEREAMYPVANFGSSMASFYTVLALWVGALVMVSTMRIRLTEERLARLRQRFGKVMPRHEFFGRYGIFGFIMLLQSLLLLLGDLFLLHIQCENPVMFVLFGIFIGQVFCLIVYTLSELFGDVGKAVCVILLIMQVAASGGTFPVQMLDRLLGDISPFLPFYHAMRMLQECVAGIDWSSVVVCAGALLVTVGIMLLVGVVVRKPFRKLNIFFEEQLEKTGLM